MLLQPLFLCCKFPRRFYNTARTMTSAAAAVSTQRMFQLKLDPLSGNSEWVVIEEEEEEEENGNQTIPKALLATTSYLDMLNDNRRNRAFRKAIEKTITKPCHVLDIGAGTGLLSMMSYRAMFLADSDGSKGTVTACESYLPMIKLMRKVVRANGMDGKIRVFNKRSDELKVGVDIPSRADVLVSEILDSELLGEGLIPTLQHAHDNLLVENPQTVPYRATTYGQLVECTYLWEKHGLANKEAKASDGIYLVPSGNPDLLGVKQQQFAMHCDAIKDEIKLLSKPFKIFDFDFWRRPKSSNEIEMYIKATNDGTVHAIISWWVLQLDSDGTVFYSTEPKWIGRPSDVKDSSGNWCDHWKQTIWFIPNTDFSVSRNEEVQLRASHDETSISYEFNNLPIKKAVDSDTRDCQILLSPERNAIYGDIQWRCLMLNAVQRALHQRESSLCLVADDSIFLTVVIAHFSKNSHLMSLFPGLAKKGSHYLQKVAAANNFSMDQIKIIKKRDLLQSALHSHRRKVNLLVAEPFYYGNDSGLPWQNLRFWKERTLLDGILSEDVQIMPCRGLLKACAVYLPEFWRSRCCLKEIEGFDHSMVNTVLGACGDLPAEEDGPFLPVFAWQCGEMKILSEIITVLEFDFSKPISPCSGKAQVQFREAGIVHGFVLWIDYVMDEEDNTTLSTGPDKRHWKQAVKLLSKPVDVKGDDFSSMEIEAFFNPSDGDLNIQHAFL